MDTLEIVTGASCYLSMKKSDLNNNIVNFDFLFNIADLSNIDEYKVTIPNEIYENWGMSYFKDEIDTLMKFSHKNGKIRIWTSHYDVYSYLTMLYLCNLLEEKNSCNLYVLYTDEYKKHITSPACINSDEFKEYIKFEHKLSTEEKLKFSEEWKKIVRENSDMRIIENEKIQSIPYDYYDDFILDGLKKMGPVKVVQLGAYLMKDMHFQDSIICFLIKRLVESNKIKVLKENEDNRFWHSVITVNNH